MLTRLDSSDNKTYQILFDTKMSNNDFQVVKRKSKPKKLFKKTFDKDRISNFGSEDRSTDDIVTITDTARYRT